MRTINIMQGRIIEDNESNQHTCEWCKTTYPNFDTTVIYYCCEVFSKKHIVCNECLENLRLIECVKDKETAP